MSMYTESANFTTPAIKCRGDYLNVNEVIDMLNRLDKLEAALRTAKIFMEKSEKPFYDGMKILNEALNE